MASALQRMSIESSPALRRASPTDVARCASTHSPAALSGSVAHIEFSDRPVHPLAARPDVSENVQALATRRDAPVERAGAGSATVGDPLIASRGCSEECALGQGSSGAFAAVRPGLRSPVW